MKAYTLIVAGMALAGSASSQTLVDFEIRSGYNPASSFITPGEPGVIDGWYILGEKQLPPGVLVFGSKGARVTPDPVVPLLGGSGTLTFLEGLQSAAVTSEGALLARPFGDANVSGDMTVSYKLILGNGNTGSLLSGSKKTIAEFRYSDKLNGQVPSFPAGVRLNQQSANAEGSLIPVEVLTANQTWIDIGSRVVNNHLLKIEIQLNAAANRYTVFITDLTAAENPVRVNNGTFPANGVINGDANAIRAQGGVVLSSKGGTAIYDEIAVVR